MLWSLWWFAAPAPLAGPSIPGQQEQAPREAISAEESLDDFDPLEGMVVNGQLQTKCVYQNVRPGISFAVYGDDAWLRPSTGQDRRLVTRDGSGALWRVDHPRLVALGGVADGTPVLTLREQTTPIVWNAEGDVVLDLSNPDSSTRVYLTVSGSPACSMTDDVMAAAAAWYWIGHRAAFDLED